VIRLEWCGSLHHLLIEGLTYLVRLGVERRVIGERERDG
jgi:hypothetical protein